MIVLIACVLIVFSAALFLYSKRLDSASLNAFIRHRNSRNNTNAARKKDQDQRGIPIMLAEFYQQSGFNIDQRQASWASAIVLSFILASIVFAGVIYGALVLGMFYSFLKFKAIRSGGRIKEQFLAFVEDLQREMMAGFNVEQAFRRIASRTPPPLHSSMQRVLLRRDVGMDLDDALAIEGRVLKMDEMTLFATLLRVNKMYGGKLRDSLVSLTSVMRQQDKSHRELSAMTGETRVTAVVLCAMPILIGGYILLSNPEFSEVMITTSTGRKSLAIAVFLQAVGMFIVWKMVRRV